MIKITMKIKMKKRGSPSTVDDPMRSVRGGFAVTDP